MVLFDIPYPKGKRAMAAWNRRFGLNAYYAGKHWAKRNEDAEDLHLLCRMAMKKAGIAKGFCAEPVEIIFRWDDGLDIDNHAALGKAFVDAMKDYLIEDDCREYFRRVTHEFWNGGRIRVEVRPYRE